MHSTFIAIFLTCNITITYYYICFFYVVLSWIGLEPAILMGNEVTEVLLTFTVFTFFCFNSCTCRRSGCRKGRTGQGYRGVPGTKCQGHQTSSGEIMSKEYVIKILLSIDNQLMAWFEKYRC